jgi:NAD(P)-dependent dehydrogenase (short-subunit alcohol dehydrogenase family)
MSVPVFPLKGRVAIITGGKRGIGKAIALTFAGAGASVIVCSRASRDGELQAVADEIKRLGHNALAVAADVSNQADVNRMVTQVMDEFGAIDILVNNAAVPIRAPLMDTSEADWDRVMNVDLKGYYLCAQACGRVMMAQKRGNIINIASRLGIKATPDMGAYSVAKAGELMLTRVLALELASYHIRVNAIAPGLVETEGSAHLWSQPEVKRQFESVIPLGRIALPGDIAAAALFLASDASSYITGHTMVVDGGMQA